MSLELIRSKLRWISPATLGIGLLCFALPFMDVSCGGQVMRFNGVQLVTGTTIEQPQMFGPPTRREIPGEPLARVALGCGLVALAASCFRKRGAVLSASVASGAAFAALLALKLKLDRDVLREGQGMISLGYGIGFWLSSVLFLGSAVLCGVLASGAGSSEAEREGSDGTSTPELERDS